MISGGILIYLLQQVTDTHIGGIALDHIVVALERRDVDGEIHIRIVHVGVQFFIGVGCGTVLIGHRIVVIVETLRTDHHAVLSCVVDLSDGSAQPGAKKVGYLDPLFHGIVCDDMEVGVLCAHLVQGRTVPFTGMRSVDELDLGVFIQQLIEPLKSHTHGTIPHRLKACEVQVGHIVELFDLFIVHLGAGEGTDIAEPLLVFIQTEFFRQLLFRFEKGFKLREEEIQMDGTGDHGIVLRYPVLHDTVSRSLAPADVCAFGSVLVEIVKVAFLLFPGQDLLPVEIHDFVQFAHIVVDEGVERLIVIHGRSHDDFRLFPEEVFQFFPVHKLEQFHGVPSALQFRHEEGVAVQFPDDMFIEDEKIQSHM